MFVDYFKFVIVTLALIFFLVVIMAVSKFACAHALHDYKFYSCSVFFILTLLVYLSGGLYKGTEAPQGAAGSAYDAMCSAKRKILAQGTSFFFLVFFFVLFCFG